jgi:hypothetical protein
MNNELMFIIDQYYKNFHEGGRQGGRQAFLLHFELRIPSVCLFIIVKFNVFICSLSECK